MEANQKIKDEVKILEDQINALVIAYQNKYPLGYLTLIPVTEDHAVFDGKSKGPIQLLVSVDESASS